MKPFLFAVSVITTLSTTAQGQLPVFVEVPAVNAASLRSVNFADAQVGYIGGDFLTLLKTTDGGLSWTGMEMNGIQAAGFENDKVIDLHFSSATHGYCIVEFYSAMYETTDGGASWTGLIDTPGNLCFPVDFEYVTENFQVLAGKACFGGATVARKVDEWENTALMLDEGESRLLGISFFNESIGAAVSNSGIVYLTANGGDTWSGTEILPGGMLTSVKYADENTMYITAKGEGAGLYVSHDGGTNWAADATLPENSTLDLYGFLTGSIEVTYGMDAESGSGILAFRQTGSKEWTTEIYSNPLQAGYTLPDGNIVIVGLGGRVLRSDFTSSTTQIDRSKKSWQLYPNPASGLVFIQGANLDMGPIFWKAFSTTGQTVASGLSTSGNMDLSGLESGFYLMELSQNGNSLGVGKVVKN